MSDVVLTAALRNNLLSLQNTQSLIDKTQLRLATGLKVNSALDNPQNFFAAQSLGNRAGDLTRLLDGIGQSITSIKQANTAVESLTTLVEQADSVAQQAREALAGSQQEAKVTGGVDLSGVDDLTDLTGITSTDDLVFSFIDSDGTVATQNIQIITAVAAPFDATSSDQLVTQINSIVDADGNTVFAAKLNDDGQLEITEKNGNLFEIDFESNANTLAADNSLANALGFGSFVTNGRSNELTTNAADEVRLTVGANASLQTVSLYDITTDEIATRSTILTDLSSVSSGAANDIFAGSTGDTINIAVNGKTAVAVATTPNAATIQDLIDGINSNTSLNTYLNATFDETTGQLNIRAIDSTVTSVQVSVIDSAGADVAVSLDTAELGIGIRDSVSPLLATDATANSSASESIQLGAAAGNLAQLESDYNNIRDQIDALVSDSGYRGVNLLNGDDLTTFFNEDRSNSLITEGVTFTSAGLGIAAANFGRADTVDGALSEIRTATASIRDFGGSIANDLAILQTREDFTKNTVNNLNEGHDKLVVADQNEEGANLLALQTRQTLGVTSLSLASQSQQSVLRLF